MRAAIYARVSTNEQREAMQIDELRGFCAHRGWTIAAEFIDHGISGAAESRPQLDAMMLQGARGKFDAVVVWKFDRFGRSLEHLVTALNQFRAWRVEFVSVTENIDTSTPMGRIVFAVMGALAEFERSLISQRVKSGMEAARARGQVMGRPRSAARPDDVWELVRVQGKSIRQCAGELGISPGTVINLLRTARKTDPIIEAARNGEE